MTPQRGSVRREVRIAAPASAVWPLVGDPARLTEWFPGITSCTVEGDRRTIVAATGLPMPERIVTIDHALRRFQYRLEAPMIVEHLSTIDVVDLGDGSCLVVYGVDAQPAMMALVIGGAAGHALENLRAVVEGAA